MFKKNLQPVSVGTARTAVYRLAAGLLTGTRAKDVKDLAEAMAVIQHEYMDESDIEEYSMLKALGKPVPKDLADRHRGWSLQLLKYRSSVDLSSMLKAQAPDAGALYLVGTSHSNTTLTFDLRQRGEPDASLTVPYSMEQAVMVQVLWGDATISPGYFGRIVDQEVEWPG